MNEIAEKLKALRLENSLNLKHLAVKARCTGLSLTDLEGAYKSFDYDPEDNCIGASVGGYACAIFTTTTEFASPKILGFRLSLEVLIWVALGGNEVLIAYFVCAVVYRILEAFFSDTLAYCGITILGLFSAVSVMFFPRGIFGSLFSER